MKIIEKYTGEKTYMFPNGMIASPDVVYEQYPAAKVFVHIVETDENREVMFAFQNLSAMRSFYNIDNSLSEDAAITVIQEIVNTKPAEPDETESTAEERIAAALEYQNIASMEIVNADDPDEEVTV